MAPPARKTKDTDSENRKRLPSESGREIVRGGEVVHRRLRHGNRYALTSDNLYWSLDMSAQLVNAAVLWFAVAAFCSGCGQHDDPAARSSDANLRSRLTGTWAIDGRGAMTLGPDGTFSSRWTNAHVTPMAVWQYDGVWAVTDGVCVSTVTNSQSWGTTNRAAAGTDYFRILALDERELVWESEGQTNSLKRKK
jgi:hypothetical protein